jgi:Uma2 family endonuclease
VTQIATLPEPTLIEPAPVEQETSAPVNGTQRFPRQGEWTYEDWLNFPNDGWKYEIIDGVLHMSPPPLILHQDVSGELFARMRTRARQKKLGKVLEAPCGVRLPGQTVPVEPDILFVKRSRLQIVGERYVEGAPDLIVEILSPSNATYDLETKFDLYQRSGVREYWIVNAWDRTVTIYNLVNGVYQLSGVYGIGDTAVSRELTSFTLKVTTIFEF